MDLKSNISPVLAVAPEVLSATKSDAPVVDLQGADSATVVIVVGAVAGSGDFTPSIRHGDAANLAGDAAATADDLIGALPTILAQNTTYTVGYRGGKRYMRVVLTKNGGTSVAAGATVIKGHLAQRGAA